MQCNARALVAVQATYLADYIARGEAPLEIRNVFRQRSRWTKGHYQVFYSRHNPLINFDLPVFQRLMYAYATWSPMCTVLTVPGELHGNHSPVTTAECVGSGVTC